MLSKCSQIRGVPRSCLFSHQPCRWIITSSVLGTDVQKKKRKWAPRGPQATQDESVLGKKELHKPGDNYKADGYIITKHTHRLLQEHISVTGGQVRTRFPPEPNGLLHIGHAKAINLNFGYAKANGGICFLRFDDTNPEMEEEKFAVSIQEMVEWLGFKPYKVTYASDYFPQLYSWAEDLIQKNLAYVCHMTQEEMRQDGNESPWKERLVEESLKAFRDMKSGKYEEGKAVLRLKMTTDQGTVDPVAYRIKYQAHHRTGTDWCIYPTYDFAHGLCDSIEHITHSLCTTEFQLRRSTYYWLCNSLNIYCPVQTEYGRLNLLHSVVSKRHIGKLISEGCVTGWDDPRLFTLVGLQRRGIPPEAINEFCQSFWIRPDAAFIHPNVLEDYARKHLQKTVPRRMAVLRPLKVNITNFPCSQLKTCTAQSVLKGESFGMHTLHFQKELYIDMDDFREEDCEGFWRLKQTQHVGLKHTSHVIYLQKVNRGSYGELESLEVTCKPLTKENKPKTYIHWVANPVRAEFRIYSHLFHHKNPLDPEQVAKGFLSDVNKDSLQIVHGLVDPSLVNAKPYEKFQFERVGFFSVDPDSSSSALIFNRVVSLKQDKGFASGSEG